MSVENIEKNKNIESENPEKEKQNKRKYIFFIIIILLLSLVLVKLFFEFGLERQRMLSLREKALEAQRIALQNQGAGELCEETRRRLKELIDIFCEEDPENCEMFRQFTNIDELMRFADSLRAIREQNIADSLQKLIEYLCEKDPANCEKFRQFTDIDELARFADSLQLSAALAAQSALDERRFADSIARERRIADSLQKLIEALCKEDPANCEKYRQFTNIDDLMRFADSLQKLIEALCKEDPANCEKFRQFTNIDDLTRFADSLRQAREKERQAALTAENCKDLSPLWVYPEPAGGLHFDPIRVKFSLSRPANVYYKRSREADFRRWGGEDILISQNTDLFFRAVDECGNVFTEQRTVYAFGERQVQRFCPPNMALIQSADPQFCIDQYMWPNERGVLPMNLVSHLQARDLCASVGKRLCTAEEWEAACKGPNNWRFPYGNNFLSWACVTQDTTFRRSGEASACRSWYAVFDMSGNLAEWTNTRAPQNNRFFVVKGGFWESGQSANCQATRFSYHPQNRHNPVGFRCCKDLSEASE